MNKELCKYHKAKGTFKRSMCGTCSYHKRCIDRLEWEQGHNDERRDATNDAPAEAGQVD
jgi:hypothetical protein